MKASGADPHHPIQFSAIYRTLVYGFYSTLEMQSAYSTTPTDRALVAVNCDIQVDLFKLRKILLKTRSRFIRQG